MKASFRHEYGILSVTMTIGIKRILLVLHLGGTSGRELLSGVFSFIKPKITGRRASSPTSAFSPPVNA